MAAEWGGRSPAVGGSVTATGLTGADGAVVVVTGAVTAAHSDSRDGHRGGTEEPRDSGDGQREPVVSLKASGSCNMVIAASGSVSCPSTTIGKGVAGDVGAVGTGVTDPATSTSSWSALGESAAVAEVGDTGSDEASSPASLLPGLSGGPPSSPPSPPSHFIRLGQSCFLRGIARLGNRSDRTGGTR